MEILEAKTVLLPGKGLIDCLWVLSAVMFFIACNTQIKQATVSLPYYNTADFTPLWMDEKKFSADTIHSIQSFNFTDQDGRSVDNKMLKGKIYVANFFFTACGGICPKMTGNMKMIADSFKSNSKIAFLSYSVTPEKDSVAVLKKYADNYGIAGKQWHLLTGDATAINNIARQSYFIEKTPGLSRDSTEFLHTENFVLVDGKGHIRGLYKGTLELEAMRLMEDINILLKEF